MFIISIEMTTYLASGPASQAAVGGTARSSRYTTHFEEQWNGERRDRL